jgi:hypothetical protein
MAEAMQDSDGRLPLHKVSKERDSDLLGLRCGSVGGKCRRIGMTAGKEWTFAAIGVLHFFFFRE